MPPRPRLAEPRLLVPRTRRGAEPGLSSEPSCSAQRRLPPRPSSRQELRSPGARGATLSRGCPNLQLRRMRFYLTTPIFYINSTPHIGHAYTTIAADVVVRHHRQRGDETFFLTGTDEHASKVARVAAEQGLDPRAYTDRIVGAWQELPRRVAATNAFFIRTS